jgi:hypothetical protein
MKKIIYLLAMFVFTLTTLAQPLASADVPLAVHSAFKKANPAGQNAVWNRDKTHYQVKYIADKKPRTQTYTKSGTLVVHDAKVALTLLPPAVKTYIDKNYAGQSIDKVLKMTKPDGSVNYNLEINGTDLFFDAKGNYLRSAKK